MKPETITHLLHRVQQGVISIEEATIELEKLPFTDLGHTVVDHHRELRTGFPEVVFGENKSPAQLVAILSEMRTRSQQVLATRVNREKAEAVRKDLPELDYDEEARCLYLEQDNTPILGCGKILVVTAGTSDIPVAKEALLVARMAGNEVALINDVGVAGVHRLLHRLDELRSASVIIVVAGMEGALPSVVGGLVSAPVIAVPTSVGYGVAMNGMTALFGMLSSCASGVTVVNIDNGFGAGYAAALMNRIGKKATQ
ncbi:MAG: nickel pincer cofactor biosynthesis protein LarB [Deltaproteobacteria bacterium]|nr:nickel pincer cofactor biosynthesis protein LarB [Deltaproteobacteria bacterium]MBN2672493.1 nickel pincer cofactor biosynthesis protein LarB [Deltaproteobacteria bacterium]